MSIKSVEVVDPNSCLNKAAQDEPIFVLRANDPCAPLIVATWAAQYLAQKTEQNTVAISPELLTEAQKAKAREACDLAEAMQVWQRRHGIATWRG